MFNSESNFSAIEIAFFSAFSECFDPSTQIKIEENSFIAVISLQKFILKAFEIERHYLFYYSILIKTGKPLR
jgi:hypothetical protein